MNSAYRPRRTCLSVPGSNRKMIEKAKGLPADEVFLDLEDAVAPDAKARARTQVAAALAGPAEYLPLAPTRVLDTRTAAGLSTVDGASLGIGLAGQPAGVVAARLIHRHFQQVDHGHQVQLGPVEPSFSVLLGAGAAILGTLFYGATAPFQKRATRRLARQWRASAAAYQKQPGKRRDGSS